MNPGYALQRRRLAREYCYFNWRRRTAKFSDECSVERKNAEWAFRYPYGMPVSVGIVGIVEVAEEKVASFG